MLGLNREKEKKMLAELAQLPKGASLANPPELPARSHKYASGLAEFEQLEGDLEQARLWGQEQANARAVAEAVIAEMKREFDAWRHEHTEEHNRVLDQRDRALDELGDIKTRLHVVREQIDRIFHPPLPVAQMLPVAPAHEDIPVRE